MNPEDQMRDLLRTNDDHDLASEREWEAFRARAHRSLALRRTLVGGVVVALVALGIAGAATLAPRPVGEPRPQPPAGTDRPRPTSTPSPTGPSPDETEVPAYGYPAPAANPDHVVEVYFLQGEQLTVSHRDIGDTEGIATAAMHALLAGPELNEGETGIFSSIPEGTELLGLTIEDGVATVDLSADFSDTGLGTCCEHLPLAQVVWTLTQFRTVGSVVFEIEGQPVEAYGGHGIVLDGPQDRADYEDAARPIVVETPYTGQRVESVFVLEGTANVFEANVSYRVVTPNGDVVAEGFTTAECGTGCRGRFAETVNVFVEKRTQAWLEVYEASAEDGSPLHMEQISITIDP